MTQLYRGEAITELVKEAAALVTEAKGFDSDEQAAHECRLRPLAIGYINGRTWRIWTNASVNVDGDPSWVRWVAEGSPKTDSKFENVPDDAGQPAWLRDDWVGPIGD